LPVVRRPATRPTAFGLKDVFTTINVLGGAIAIVLCLEDRPFAAGISILLGYFCGDAIDGWVARKLGTANRFGVEYDSIADHLAHVLAPAVVVYTVYRDAPLGLAPLGSQLVGGGLACFMLAAASIRHARNIVFSVEWKGAWAGLPRSVLGFSAIGLANARLTPDVPGGYWLGVAILPALSILMLTYVPYPNHRMRRAHHPYVRVLIGLFFVTTIASLILYPRYLFDILFFWMFGYAAGSWVALTPAERAEYREAVVRAREKEQRG
jgi:phosphatidylserine synthase